MKPGPIARPYLDEVREGVAALAHPLKLVGILGTDMRASAVYADYAAQGCERVGIHFERRRVAPEQVSREIFQANEDPEVHGVIVFYPVFGGTRDRSLQNEVHPHKDVEGLHASWAQRLYHDVRYVDPARTKKAVLPCTPLGILKALRYMGALRQEGPAREAARGLQVTIFNRSEVVGRPLAAMLAHDGARVFSFDEHGPLLYESQPGETPDPEGQPTSITRAEALAQADVVITGVPSREFPRVRADEIRPEAICVNFSHVKNLEDEVSQRARHTLLRVGPITIAMLLRNTLRLYRNFHAGAEG